MTCSALVACAAGLAVGPEDVELHCREAVVHRLAGDREGAERCWRRKRREAKAPTAQVESAMTTMSRLDGSGTTPGLMIAVKD